MKRLLLASSVTIAVVALTVSVGLSQGKVLKIGNFCDRLGPTQTIGVKYCVGFHDYMDLINSRGGVDGHKIEHNEIEHAYAVPKAVEGYNKFKSEGYLAVVSYGTPITDALKTFANRDKISLLTPGFGISDVEDATKFPYVFVGVASYKSQIAAIYQYIKESWKENRAAKVAYLFYDNPAGREPIDVLADIAEKEGFQLKTFAVPPPGVEMGAQVLDIAQRFRADFVVAHLFGGAPSVSIKEFKRVGYALRKVVSFVWGAAEANIDGAGGFGVAEGYSAMQFAGVGTDYPVLNEIRAMYKKQGKEPPREMASTVFYNRGVLIGALHVEAIRHAVKAKPDGKITGADAKAGFEKISNFTLGGLVPPLKITPTDHEGGGLVQIWQVKGGKFVKVTDWFAAYQDVVAKHIKESGAKK
jgi:branched-chain amino acid transport system substrate-binding protein